MNDIRDVLADNLRKFRHALGWSQAKLAEKARTSTQYVGMIEGRIKYPSAETIHNLAKALSVDPTELFYKENTLAASMKSYQRAAYADVGAAVNQLVSEYITERIEKLNDDEG